MHACMYDAVDERGSSPIPRYTTPYMFWSLELASPHAAAPAPREAEGWRGEGGDTLL